MKAHSIFDFLFLLKPLELFIDRQEGNIIFILFLPQLFQNINLVLINPFKIKCRMILNLFFHIHL